MVPEQAKSFEKLVSMFNARDVMQNPAKGTRVILKTAQQESSTDALVISLTEGNLFVRRVFDRKAKRLLKMYAWVGYIQRFFKKQY